MFFLKKIYMDYYSWSMYVDINYVYMAIRCYTGINMIIQLSNMNLSFIG